MRIDTERVVGHSISCTIPAPCCDDAVQKRASDVGVVDSEIEETLRAVGDHFERQRDALIELIVNSTNLGAEGEQPDQKPVWEPYAWHGSVRTATPRPTLALAPVLVFGCATTAAGLAMIAMYSANMSPENTRLWFMTTFWSLVLKIAVLDPMRLVFQMSVLQCAENWMLTRGLIEDTVHKSAVKRRQGKQKQQRTKVAGRKSDVCFQCFLGMKRFCFR